MAAPRRLVALVVTLSFIFVGTVLSQKTEETPAERQPEVNWEDDRLSGELEALCLSDQWTQAGQLVPGVNFSTILYTVRSAWQAGSLLQVASLVCVQYGPILNVLSDGLAKTLCEPVIEAVYQGSDVNIEGICYQLWQMIQQIQHGGGISFEPPCQKQPTDDRWPSWPHPTNVYDNYPYPDGTKPPWFNSDKDHEGQYTYPPWGKPDSNDYVTLPPWYSGDTENHDSPFWFDIWEVKQILEETFSSLGKYSGDFCYHFSAVMFNDSVASFDVVDHALHAIFESFSYKVYEKCHYVDNGGRTSQEPDAATLVLSYLTETNGAEDLCQLLQNGVDSNDESLTDIAENATNKMFEVLQNEDTCLGLYDTLSPFTDFITQTTGFYLGELVCDYIVSSFDANDEPSLISSGLTFDGTKEFLGGNNWTLPEEFGYVLPGIPFQEAVTVFAQVLNSNTAANGMKLLCTVLSPILDAAHVEMCSALEEHDYYRFLDSCHNFTDWLYPAKDDMYDYPIIEGTYLINEFFQHFYHLQEIASQFNNETHHHIDVRDILQSVYHSDPEADYEDTCTIVGNVLYESDSKIKDIIFSIIEKDLLLLYHIAPHFCEVPLDPGNQWPGEGEEYGDKFPPDNQWTEGYGHEETWTYDTPINGDGEKDEGQFFDKNEDTYGWFEVTTDGNMDPNHYPPYHSPHDDIDPWWDIKIGPFQGKIIEKLLAFLSGYSDESAFCAHAIETFYYNETIYYMQSIEKVQQMKERLKTAVEEYESCLPLVNILKENLTEYGFHEITGYDSAESLCSDMVNAFSIIGQNPNPDAEFYWPNHRDMFYTFGDDYTTIKDDMQDQTVAGELAPGVSLSSFIQFTGQLYNAPIMDGANLLCNAFGEFMGHFETESCGFLQSSRPKHEFIEYCQSYGTYDDGHYDHDGHHEHHESDSSFLSFLPWEHLPTTLSEVFGVAFSSEPMCTLGWDLFTSQSVKTSLQEGFQVLTRLLIIATADVECDSDHEYVTFVNDTHFVIDYLYDYNEGGEGEMDFDFLGLLYSYLGGYEDVVALCTEVKSALEDSEAINNMEAEMSNRLFQLLENQTACVSFLNIISTKLDHNSAGMTVGKLAGMESNEDFCSSLTGYMNGEKEISFNDITLFEEIKRLSEMGGDNLLINSTLTDNILQVAASIYRSDNIQEATDIICPVVEMIPDLDPELGLLDTCFYLQTVNATSFKELCTDNLQYYIPYFWIWVNHNSNYGDDKNEREDQDYWDNDQDDFGNTNDFLGHVSIYTIKRIFRHTFGVLLFDSTVFCYGIDSWLQANSGAGMIGTLFRLFQMVLISQSSYICPTYYSYMSEPPVEQPDLEFGGTDFIDVIGAINTFLGNYSDYEYLCWDVQTAYLEWDYDGDSTRMDEILDQLTDKFMEVLHDVDQCLALASAMNRLPIVGPVAAQFGFESNEMLCEFVVSQFASTQDLQINYEFLRLLFSDKHEDSEGESEEERGGEREGPDEVTTHKWEDGWNEPDGWTLEEEENEENVGDDGEMQFNFLRLGIQEMIKVLVGIYNKDVAISALSDACDTAQHLAPNNSFLMEVSFICDQIGTDGSVLGTCLDNFVDLFDDGKTYYDAFPRATQPTVTESMSGWMYLQDVISKLGDVMEHVYDMYSGYGLNYNRLKQVAFNIQANLGIGSFNLEEPFSGCSFLRLVLSFNHNTLVDHLISSLAYPIGDFLEYISQFGLCYIEEAATGEENTDIVAYHIIKNLLQLFLGMDDAQFCLFMAEDHTLEEYRAQGKLIADKIATIFSDEVTCVDVLSVVAAEDRYNMLFNLTGMDLSKDENRLVFCQHLVSSFSVETQYVPSEYMLLRGETLENWQPFSIPGQLLPQLDFSNLVSILGAVYSSPTLLEGTGILCNVFKNILVEESDNLGASVEAVCDAVEHMNLTLVEMYCLNFTVPGYYGKDYPVNLRPIDEDRVGISILLQLFGTAQLTRESEVCPALDSLFSSDWNLRNVVSLVLNTWLEELIPTAAGICQSWDDVVLYLSPMRHSGTYNEYTGDYNYFPNWTTTTVNDDGVEEAQELYEHTINTVTHLISSILGYPDRESLCDFIQSGINSTTGVVIKEILVTIQTRLSAAFTDLDVCTLTIESIIDLLQIELHMIPTLYDITGYDSPREFCAVTTEFLAEEGCFAEVDCFGVCGGLARLDCAGVCNGTAREDCTGVCEGEAELDCFGVCEGDAELDCTGECGGKAILSDCTYECVGGSTGKPEDSGYDECELCTHSEDYKDVRDCAGTCSGTASVDLCGECTGGETGLTFDESRLDCNDECDGTAYEDCLGNCIIAGEIGAVEDACGICDGSNSACVFSLSLQGMEADVETELTVIGEGFYSADLENSCVFETFDGVTEEVAMSVSDSQTGVCNVSLPEGVYSVYVNVGTVTAGGDPQTIEVWSSCSEGVDCTGVCGGATSEDCNGVCGGSAVLDCADICGGTLVLDCAGVCGGDTQEDCAGICNGDTPVDCSGTCNGTAEEDCSGVCQGTAFMNDCGYCVGGTTGRSESLGYDQCGVCKSTDGYVDTRDCHGTCNGQAYVDECGECVGGETGKTSEYETRKDCNDVCDGTWQEDACGICEPDGDSSTSKYEDCSNTCIFPGSGEEAAFTNVCQECVGGQTGLPENYGIDACGVCGGTNETCKGCDGIPNSGVEYDACGVCGGTGSSCIVVSSLDRNIILTNEATEVTVSGAGFTSDKVYTCTFSGPEDVTTTMTPSELSSGTFTVTLPQTGAYTFSLLADDEALSVVDDATLTVYAIDAITIESISPSKPLASDGPTTFTVTANAGAFTTLRDLDVALHINVYESGASQTPTELAASFDHESSNTLTFIYNVSNPVQVILKTYFDGYGELPGDGLELTFYAPSPELTALYFNSLGSAIIAEFGSLVDTSVLQLCSDILADTTKLGTDHSCEWQSPQRLIIIIGNGDNLISVGDSLTFKRASIVALFEDYPYPEDADSIIEMTVAAPDTTPSVRALLYGSSVVSNCGRIKGVLYSQGAAGREFNYQWTVTSSGNTSNVEDALSALSGSTLDIDATLLDAGVDYIIIVTVTNFFGGSDTASLTVQRSARQTPDVIVNAIGIDKDNAYVSDSAVLVADIFYSECAPAGDTVFSWTVDSDEVALSLKRSSRNLFVPANSLPGGTSVTFTVRIYKSSEPDNYVEESITITTSYSELKPVISQGKLITVGQDSGNVELDGTLSWDPDSVALVMTYEWQCEQQAVSGRQQAFNERKISDNTACWSYKSGHTGETILENADPAAAILTFDAEHMDVNKIYMFTLIVRKGLRSASTFIFVTPVAGTPPEISINPVSGSHLSGDILAIQATIKHTSALSQAVWSTTDTDSGNGYVDLTDSSNFIRSPVLRQEGSDSSFSFFALQRNVLAPGATYSFKLTVTTEDDETSEATVEVKVRSIITSCVISLDDGSTSYTELEPIILAVDSCTTDEDAYPLTFQVFLQNTDGSYEAKTAAEASDRISVLGPPALLTNNDIPYNTFQVKVCDKFKVCKTFEESFSVDPVQLDQTEVTSAVENLVEVEESRQNYEKAFVNINMLVIRLGSESVGNSLTTTSRRRRAVDETSAINEKRLDLAQNHMDNNVMDTKSAELLISELSMYDTDNSTQDDMETLVDQYSDLVNVFTEAEESIPEVSSVKMLEKLNEIKKKVPSTASRMREKVANLTSNLEKTHFRDLQLGGEERKTETGDSKLVLKRDIPQARMTFDSSFSVKVAGDIISNFGADWSCSSGSCSGVTFRFKLYNDSVDDYSETATDIANRAAAIVEFSLHDPDSDEELTISDLTDTVSFNLTITRPQDNVRYECRFWNSTTLEWSSDGLTSVQIEADVVTCESYHLSTFTLVVVDPLTTVAPTTQQGPSSQAISDGAEDSSSETESVTENGGDEATDDSSTQGNTPLPSGGGSGAVIGVIVAVVGLVLVGAAVIGVFFFVKTKGGSNKVTSEGNFEAAHPAPVPTAPPAEAAVSASPRRPETPVAFETADPVAVPLQAEPNMPPPPSVFVPPGDEATVVTETEPPHHPHSPEPALEPDVEESSNNDSDPSPGAKPNEDVQESDGNLPEPSE
ncbi:hypothetical protein HOLleu_28882 [Holothuria leucospilota]|uniref:PKD/REJ-like domain-containing protein n=1 Tax=Holothuria leucospilota TaxID=206669 RepID=A0A9Q1BMZ0_HOLLE|nr:hypothetical protein HOLleu_28882 [Holothuria leucospilota]